jgi:hypothetical protein
MGGVCPPAPSEACGIDPHQDRLGDLLGGDFVDPVSN